MNNFKLDKRLEKDYYVLSDTSGFMKMNSFYTWEGNTLRLNVLGTPSAKQNKIGKVKGKQLKISVSCAPEKGKATDCMIKFISKEFGVRKSDITLVFGLTSINKQFLIDSPQRLPNGISYE